MMTRIFTNLVGVSFIFAGLAVVICNIFKIVPNGWETNDFLGIIAIVIAYGIITGPILAILGVALISESNALEEE